MQREEVLARVEKIRRHRSGDAVAPHKPLLLLYALGRLKRGMPRLARWSEMKGDLERLLEAFGFRHRKGVIHPFWRLPKDGLWEIEDASRIDETASGDPSVPSLEAVDPKAGLPQEVYDALRRDPALVEYLTEYLLEGNFPYSLHEELRDAVGLRVLAAPAKSNRDPGFRWEILRLYEQRCAVCGYDGRLDTTVVALDAAHVRFACCDGPSVPENGLALCAIHHRAFDRGVLSLSDDRRILVSSHFVGSDDDVDSMILRYANRDLRKPQDERRSVAVEHIQWHRNNVFREPARGV